MNPARSALPGLVGCSRLCMPPLRLHSLRALARSQVYEGDPPRQQWRRQEKEFVDELKYNLVGTNDDPHNVWFSVPGDFDDAPPHPNCEIFSVSMEGGWFSHPRAAASSVRHRSLHRRNQILLVWNKVHSYQRKFGSVIIFCYQKCLAS